MITNSSAVQVRPDVVFAFPEDLCCNCAKRAPGLKVVAQDTRLTTYLFAAGTEITFQLPLPFCRDCEPSARRRPKGIVSWLLILAIVFGVAFVALLIVEDLVGIPYIGQNIPEVAALVSVLGVLAAAARARPQPPQTSHYQPVRIAKLRREFVSGLVTGIRFRFTQPQFAKTFRQLNAAAIKAGTVEVVGA